MATLAKAPTTHEEIEKQIQELQARRTGADKAKGLTDDGERVGLGSAGRFDTDIYGSNDDKYAGYVPSIAANELEEDDDDYAATSIMQPGKRQNYTAPMAVLNDMTKGEQVDPFAEHRRATIADREDEYRARRRQMIISPPRHDPFADVVVLESVSPTHQFNN